MVNRRMIALTILVVLGALVLHSCSSIPERVTLVASNETTSVAAKLEQVVGEMDDLAESVCENSPETARQIKSIAKDIVVAQNRLEVVSDIQKSVSPVISSRSTVHAEKAHWAAGVWITLLALIICCLIIIAFIVRSIIK